MLFTWRPFGRGTWKPEAGTPQKDYNNAAAGATLSVAEINGQ
jgi:hypothetical protein